MALNISIASARARQVATAELIVPTLSRGGDNGPTEKPGTYLRVFESPVRQGIFLTESISTGDAFMVFA